MPVVTLIIPLQLALIVVASVLLILGQCCGGGGKKDKKKAKQSAQGKGKQVAKSAGSESMDSAMLSDKAAAEKRSEDRRKARKPAPGMGRKTKSVASKSMDQAMLSRKPKKQNAAPKKAAEDKKKAKQPARGKPMAQPPPPVSIDPDLLSLKQPKLKAPKQTPVDAGDPNYGTLGNLDRNIFLKSPQGTPTPQRPGSPAITPVAANDPNYGTLGSLDPNIFLRKTPAPAAGGRPRGAAPVAANDPNYVTLGSLDQNIFNR